MSKRITTEDFIKAAISVHGDRYDYSKVVYEKAKIPVCIICKKHGEFWQAPDKHVHGRGCPKCAAPNKGINTAEFIKKCSVIHNGKYDYSITEYKGYTEDVKIKCPLHGEFTIKANQHLQGHGCQRCGGSKRYSTEEFIIRHKTKFGDKYDYSKTDLEHRKNNKVCVICPEHGPYYRIPTAHLRSGCPKCNMPNYRMDTKEFITRAKLVHGDKFSYPRTVYSGVVKKICVTCNKHGDIYVMPNMFLKGSGCKKCADEENAMRQRLQAASVFEEKAMLVHGNKYDYHKVVYITAPDKVCIICPEHGEFWQDPNHHLSGCGCPQCNHRSWAYTTEEFIAKAKTVHGDLYDYDQTIYVNNRTNVKIGCKKHGIFEINPSNHILGGHCPVCTALKIESRQETDIRECLERHSIRYEREKHFPWLKRGRTMPLDFYLPDYNIAIECQGIQHFKSHPWFGGTDGLKDVKDRDLLKKELCDKNGVTLLYYSDLRIHYPYDVIQSKDSLLNTIENGGKLIQGPKQLEIEF